MSTHKILLLFFISFITIITLSQPVTSDNQPTSKISDALQKRQVTHQVNLWNIAQLHADNKFNVYIEAAEYKATNSSDILQGIKFTLFSESSDIMGVALTSNTFESYLDESGYAEFLVAVNQILNQIKTKMNSNSLGSSSFISKSGIKIGFLIGADKEIAYLSILYDSYEIRSEFSNPNKFFENLKEYMNIVAKELYLPKNIEKLKKVKKSNQEAKDVIINDI